MSAPGALPSAARPLGPEEAAAAFATIMDGAADADEVARFLIKMADRGETVEEVAAAARALRQRMIPIEAPPGAIDVCGTGGDGRETLSVSTAVAILVAACGVPVAKHGNRAASGRAGAADVLRCLGLELDVPPAQAEASLAELGICFLFAANHHPAMARVAPIRRALGRRTVFNLLGPLANPAEVERQLVGVFDPRWTAPLADALVALGSEAALVVHGDGLDELAVSGPSLVAARGPALPAALAGAAGIVPEDAGLPRQPAEAVRGGDAAENAAALRRLLAGERGAYRDIVLLNAAAALMLSDMAEGWPQAAALAAEAIDSGAAARLLKRWVAFR